MATIFSDGFESGDFSAWTSTGEGAGCTVEASSTWKHAGTYSAHFICANVATLTRATKDVGAQNFVALTGYVYPIIFPDTNYNKNVYLKIIESDGSSISSEAGVTRVDGKYYWWMAVQRETSHDYYNGAEVSLDTKYYLEINYDFLNDVCKLYVDGVEVLSLAIDHTTINQPRYCIACSEPALSATSETECYIDNVQVADGYIGPETSGPRFYGDGLSWVVLR